MVIVSYQFIHQLHFVVDVSGNVLDAVSDCGFKRIEFRLGSLQFFAENVAFALDASDLGAVREDSTQVICFRIGIIAPLVLRDEGTAIVFDSIDVDVEEPLFNESIPSMGPKGNNTPAFLCFGGNFFVYRYHLYVISLVLYMISIYSLMLFVFSL